MSSCTSLQNFIQIGPPSAEKNDVMSIFKMADLSHLGFYGSNNGILATDKQTDKQTDEQMNSIDAISRSRFRERRLNNKRQIDCNVANSKSSLRSFSHVIIGLTAVTHYVNITRGQSNLTKSASRGAHSPVRGHPRGSKVVPLNSWGRVSY